MKNKLTLVLGASPNPARYSHLATLRLLEKKHTVFPVGIRKGQINGLSIITDHNIIDDIDTITLYIGSKNQAQWIDYILATSPKRVIMNPGTENEQLEKLLVKAGIEVEQACTLVLLSIGAY